MVTAKETLYLHYINCREQSFVFTALLLLFLFKGEGAGIGSAPAENIHLLSNYETLPIGNSSFVLVYICIYLS